MQPSSSSPGLYEEHTRAPLTLGRAIVSDDMATIYALPGSPDRTAKLYHTPTAEQADKLQAMLARPPHDANAPQHLSLAWPLDRVFDANEACEGSILPTLDRSESIPLLSLAQPQERLRLAPTFTWHHLLSVAGNLAAVLHALHADGVVAGERGASAALVAPSTGVTLVDCDAMQIRGPDGRIFRCAPGIPDLTPPELWGADPRQGERAPYHDTFTLAVLVFELLMGGAHPFDGAGTRGVALTREDCMRQGIWPYAAGQTLAAPSPNSVPLQVLPPALQEVMARCFVDGFRAPAARPNAQVWQLALSQAQNSLVVCPASTQHIYSAHLPECPWCARVRQGLPDLFPLPGQTASVWPVSTTLPAWSPTAITPPAPAPWSTPTPPYGATDGFGVYTGAAKVGRRGFLVAAGVVGAAAVVAGGGWLAYSSLARRAGDNQGNNGTGPGNGGTNSPASTSTAGTTYPIGATLRVFIHSGNVVALAWSPDNRRIVTACEDGTAQVWDITSGNQVLVYHGHVGPVWTVDWSRDGRYIASGGDDHTVQVWDPTSGNLIYTYTGHSAPIESLAWSPDSQRVASASDDATVQVWGGLDGGSPLVYRGHTNWAYSLDWSPDGARIASGGKDKTVQVWDSRSGQLLMGYRGHTDWVDIVAWSPDAQSIASGADDKTVQIWSPDTGQTALTYPGPGQMIGATWSPDSTQIATSDYTTSAVQIWVPTTGDVTFTYTGHTAPVRFVAWSPNGQMLASGSEDLTARVWQAQ